jgi:hypothetical protein
MGMSRGGLDMMWNGRDGRRERGLGWAGLCWMGVGCVWALLELD